MLAAADYSANKLDPNTNSCKQMNRLLGTCLREFRSLAIQRRLFPFL